jgi:hypothetical protein
MAVFFSYQKMKREVPITWDVSLYDRITVLPNSKRKLGMYFSILRKNLFLKGSSFCSPGAARPGTQYRHVLLLHIFV